MSGSRVLWGQITIVVAIVLVTIWGATQWTAWRLGLQGQLGTPWFELGDWPIYYPPLFFWWWYSYDAYAPAIFVEGAIIAASGGFFSIVVAITLSVIRAREAKNVATYGSARWASSEEVTAAGLLGPDGVVLGKLERDYLRHDGPEHVLCFAPTRSGKGVGLVVPTLLTWPGSVIVHDIKGENWGLTAGFRAGHGRVLLFDPTDPKSSAYNPLLEVRRGDWEVRDVQNFADILVDPEGALDKRNHWEKTSHSLLVGVILHVLYAEPDKTLAGVANFLSDPKRPMEATLRAMMSTPHLGEAGVHPVIASSARELLNKSDNERSGVLSTAMSFLGLYRDPVVARVTARCDWRIADLVSGKRPISLYLVVPPSDIARTKPLIRLILNQVGRRLTEELNAANRHRLLLMLDEFPALGRLDGLPKDYTGPVLGPPLPGDLGRPILDAQNRGQPVPAPGIVTPGAVTPGLNAEEQRRLQEIEAARTGRLFASTETRNTGQPATTANVPTPLPDLTSLGLAPQPATPTAQDRQLAFLNQAADRRTVAPDRVAAPASPNILQAGAVIPAALINGIRSDLPGQITAQVTENVYDSPTGRILLVPQGTRLIGQYDNGVGFGQRRVLLVWNRLIMPNDRSIVLERQPGADAEGYAGLEDGVDYHWWDLAKAAALSTLLGVVAELATDQNDRLIGAIRDGAQDTVNDAGQQIVRRQLNVQPTLTIRSGFPVRVIVTRDLVLEPYGTAP